MHIGYSHIYGAYISNAANMCGNTLRGTLRQFYNFFTSGVGIVPACMVGCMKTPSEYSNKLTEIGRLDLINEILMQMESRSVNVREVYVVRTFLNSSSCLLD